MISKIKNLLTGSILLIVISSTAQAETYPGLDTIVKETAELVRDQFVDETTAIITANELLARHAEGRYTELETVEDLAETLTTELRTISGDTHIGVVFSPESVARYKAREAAEASESAKAIAEANKAAAAEESRLDNYGMRAVEVMPGGVGYFRIDYFDGNVADSAPAIAAAMNMLESTDAIILDLRRNGGGSSRILPLFLGYFLGPDRVHFATRLERRRNTVEPLYTDAGVTGARHYDKPLYILTSGLTYSLAEQVTYHLKSFGRAIVIGERTLGGGNGWDPVVLNDDLYLRIPRLTFENAVTKTMFVESEGIFPDIPVTASEAKKRAYTEALAELHAATADDDKRRRLEWAQRLVDIDVPTSDGREACYDGRFGELVFAARKDGLWLSFRDAPFVKLERLSPGLYLDDRSIPRQFRFSTSGRSPVNQVTVLPYDSDPVEIMRNHDD